jgi:hypothetical protein
LGLRGPDTHACPNIKIVTKWLRGLVFRPGDPHNLDFMGQVPPRIEEKGLCARELEFCTQHYYSHLMHSLEVVAYCHPIGEVRSWAALLFHDVCNLFHLPVEDMPTFQHRLRDHVWFGGGQPDTFADAVSLVAAARRRGA